MSRIKLAAIAFAVILVLLARPSPTALAGDDDESGPDTEEVRVEVEIEDENAPEFLDVTLRLAFRLSPEEPDARPLVVVCSGGEYEVGNATRGPKFEHACARGTTWSIVSSSPPGCTPQYWHV